MFAKLKKNKVVYKSHYLTGIPLEIRHTHKRKKNTFTLVLSCLCTLLEYSKKKLRS